MLHLACCAFKKLFESCAAPCVPAPCGWRTCRSAALEGEIPYIMPQALAALLEACGCALGWPRHKGSVLRKIPQVTVRAQYRERSVRVGLPVSGKTQHTTGAQPVGNQLDEGRLYQAAFVVSLFRPRVGKQDQDFVQSLRCNLVCQNFNCIVADDPDMGQLALLQTQQQAADAGPMNLDAQVVAFRVDRCLGSEIVAVAETDLERDGGAAAEERIEIQKVWLKVDAVPRPE